MKVVSKRLLIQVTENAFAYIVVMAVFAYGAGKIVQFNGAADTDLRVSEMTGMQLMWAFYGYSKSFALTLGAIEILGGILMIFRRTRLIGCFFVLTILTNIIIQDIVFSVNIGALRAAVLYSVLISCILFIRRIQVIGAFKLLLSPNQLNVNRKQNVIIVILSVLLFMILRVAEYYITTKL